MKPIFAKRFKYMTLVENWGLTAIEEKLAKSINKCFTNTILNLGTKSH